MASVPLNDHETSVMTTATTECGATAAVEAAERHPCQRLLLGGWPAVVADDEGVLELRALVLAALLALAPPVLVVLLVLVTKSAAQDNVWRQVKPDVADIWSRCKVSEVAATACWPLGERAKLVNGALLLLSLSAALLLNEATTT